MFLALQMAYYSLSILGGNKSEHFDVCWDCYNFDNDKFVGLNQREQCFL